MNNKIILLDKFISSKITAGEVIEYPSDVIKELIENSLDAFSSNINIFFYGNCFEEIKVIDNGIGIRKNDIKKAFMRHSTSKLKKIEDLYNLKTLGFRGEALASIASVSKIILLG